MTGERVVLLREGDRLTFVTECRSVGDVDRFRQHMMELFPNQHVQVIGGGVVVVVHRQAPETADVPARIDLPTWEQLHRPPRVYP